MALSKVGLIADSTSLTGATLTNANAAGTFTVDQGSSNTNIFSDSVNFTANTTHSGTATFTGTANFDNATVSGVGETWNLLGSNNQTLAVNNSYAVNSAVGILTVSLPSSASIGDVVKVVDDGIASNNNIIISRNGNKINGSNVDIAIVNNREGYNFVYISSDTGWISEKVNRGTRFFGAQGQIAGFVTGGRSSGPTRLSSIEKFSFANETEVSSHGNLTEAINVHGSTSSLSHGYRDGGATPTDASTIDKFPFSSDSGATSIGNLTAAAAGMTSQQSSIDGYSSTASSPSTRAIDNRDKYSFQSDGNAVSLSALSGGVYGGAGHSSTTTGYVTSGFVHPAGNYTTAITRYPFASENNTSSAGDFTNAIYQAAPLSSDSHGYTAGGRLGAGDAPALAADNGIKKFAFANESVAEDVGDLTRTCEFAAGAASEGFGYVAGGQNPGPTAASIIEKFPFASDNNAVDSGGDLITARYDVKGNQY